MLRDILHYSKEELKELSLLEHDLALNYALDTYMRRDLVFVHSELNKKKGSRGSVNGENEGKPLDFTIEHPEIEQYAQERYEKNIPLRMPKKR